MISNQGRARAQGSAVDLRDHGWFVFFAPKENPEIAGVIFAEHGEHGYLGAPIARHVIETYYAKKEGKPLPVLKPVVPLVPEQDPDSPPVMREAQPIAAVLPAPEAPGPGQEPGTRN